MLLAGLLPAGVAADEPQRQFERLDVSKIDAKLGPAMLNNRPVTVMVELEGAPASGANLTKAQRVAAAKELKRGQDALKGRIAALGAEVLGQYQYTYNGIKVRLEGREIGGLLALPGVNAVRGIEKHELDNANSVPFIGAPAAWEDLGATGSGQTIAVIDTGIDYTHANFGGPGTVAAFDANNPATVEAGSFPTAKVIAGRDFAGNDYDAGGDNGSPVPAPDDDPLDCNGHGSHVAGSAAGNGVTTAGATYTGLYNSSTHATSFRIGPGVAPQASLVALKVFGCEGSTDLTVDALEWVGEYNATHADAIDVVNMSLGSSFGREDHPSAVQTNTLVGTGVVVVTSAGNSGAGAYITGSPGVATGAISTAAEDTLATFPGAIIDLATGTDITNANNQNDYPDLPVSGTIRAITTSATTLSLGCAAADYGALPAGSIAVVQRGVCAFVDKGAAAEAAGAVGIIVVNRDDIVDPTELPTFIGYNPEIFDIPMIGTGRGVKAQLIAANGVAATLVESGIVANPTFKRPATFTSGGPRNGDSATKPDVTGPGVSIVSTLVGSGSNGTTLSGTSMASPHNAGVAAIVRQQNPTWSPVQVKAAIMNTATVDAAKTTGFSTRVTGAGLIQPRRAIDTKALATTGPLTASLSFGYDPLNGAYTESLPVTLWNTSANDITYNLAGASIVSVPASVTVPAGGSATFQATATLSATQVAGLPYSSNLLPAAIPHQAWGGVTTFQGAIVATPTTEAAGVYALRVPFLGVPRGLSNIVAGSRSAYSVSNGIASATVPLTNSGVHGGFADVYAWGLSDADDVAGPYDSMDIRAVGVQSVPAEVLTGVPDPNDRGLVFAINTYGHWSTSAENEFDIAIFGANKTKPDYFVVGVDFGAVTVDAFDGRMASFVFDAAGNLIDAWVADGPANGSTLLLPILASDIGQTGDNQRFSYSAVAFSLQDDAVIDVVAGQAEFSVKKPAVTTGNFIALAPGQSTSLPVTVDKGKLAVAPVLGWMVVALDDPNGAAQADLVPIGRP